jgi:branched-chain amino acid transport system substrate-binding protein
LTNGSRVISGTGGFDKSMREQCLGRAQATASDRRRRDLRPGDTDMTPQLTNIKNGQGVQAVVNPGFGQGPAIVTKNYAQLGIEVPLYQSHGVASQAVHQARRRAAEGVRLPAAALLVADILPDSDPQKPVVPSPTSRPTRRGSSQDSSRRSAATPMTR